MTKGILGKKVGMTQIFTETGELIPVTVIEAAANVVLQVKTVAIAPALAQGDVPAAARPALLSARLRCR